MDHLTTEKRRQNKGDHIYDANTVEIGIKLRQGVQSTGYDDLLASSARVLMKDRPLHPRTGTVMPTIEPERDKQGQLDEFKEAARGPGAEENEAHRDERSRS
jgi:hypothetical protein